MPNLFIQSNQVLAVNGQRYIFADYVTGLVSGPGAPQTVARQIETTNVVIVNSFWLVPQVQGQKVIGYAELTAIQTSTPPTTDSIKILRLKDTKEQVEYDIAIANTDNLYTSSPPNVFAYDANGLGGSLPTMPTVVIPFPIIQSAPTSTDGTDNTFTFTLPKNPLGLLYSIPAPWFNGVAGTPAYAPSGITTPALFVVWANSNWSAYGTWANPAGDIITLVSAVTNVTLAGFIAALTPKAYCFDLSAYSTPVTVNQVKWGSSGTLISVPAFQLTDDPTVLAAQLAKVLPGQSTTYGTSVSHKLQVNTVVDTPKLYNSGTLVVTSTAGACS